MFPGTDYLPENSLYETRRRASSATSNRL